MDISQIKASITDADPHHRIRAIRALSVYPPEVVHPLLGDRLQDDEFLVRTFVARAYGEIRDDTAFAALLRMLKTDNNPNVRGEAANSLSLFGRRSVPHLVDAFFQDRDWLLRRSILGAFADDVHEVADELLTICREGIQGEDAPVRETSIGALVRLRGTHLQEEALCLLLDLAESEDEVSRIRTAHALRAFDDSRATNTLAKLRQDPSHRVIGAAMEDLLP